MNLELTEDAVSDITAAALEYEAARPGLGFRFEDEVSRALRQIADSPRIFTVIAVDVRRAVLRVFPFCVYFTIVEARPRVFAVLHQHRHPDSWRSRGP
jgi:plasmid stabilization system protein ParE